MMSAAKPMPTAQRQGLYVKQNGRLELTDRQRHRIKKTELRLEHGRHRKPKHPHGRQQRAVQGRKRAYAQWLQGMYRRHLRNLRRDNPRTKLGRATAPKSR